MSLLKSFSKAIRGVAHGVSDLLGDVKDAWGDLPPWAKLAIAGAATYGAYSVLAAPAAASTQLAAAGEDAGAAGGTTGGILSGEAAAAGATEAAEFAGLEAAGTAGAATQNALLAEQTAEFGLAGTQLTGEALAAGEAAAAGTTGGFLSSLGTPQAMLVGYGLQGIGGYFQQQEQARLIRQAQEARKTTFARPAGPGSRLPTPVGRGGVLSRAAPRSSVGALADQRETQLARRI